MSPGGASIGIAAVYVGEPQPLGGQAVSAIAKRRVEPPAELALSEINLAGDDQADRSVHGGPDKAVYAHPAEHRAAWAADLVQSELLDENPPQVAVVGENVATLGVTEADVAIGDVWSWGSATLQVCQPRWPCRNLTLHRRTSTVGPIMRASGRTGWYLRVLEPGDVSVDGSIEVTEPHPDRVTVLDAHVAMLDRHVTNRELVERAVSLGTLLADEWRLPLVERLG